MHSPVCSRYSNDYGVFVYATGFFTSLVQRTRLLHQNEIMSRPQTDTIAISLTHDDFSSLLSEMSTSEPIQGCATTNNSSNTTPIRQRQRLLAARQEVLLLQNQLAIIRENHESSESLDHRSRDECYQRLRSQALLEREYVQHARNQNVRLRQRIEFNAELLEIVRSCVSKRMERVPRVPNTNIGTQSFCDDPTVLRQSQRARLDVRTSQLDSIFRLFNITPVAFRSRISQAP